MQYNICDFGAVADGKTDSTAAIQKAIDTCAAQGGGTVIVPAGTFATDMISLRSFVEFHFEMGSRIVSLLKPVPDPNAKCDEPSSNPKRWLIGGWKVKMSPSPDSESLRDVRSNISGTKTTDWNIRCTDSGSGPDCTVRKA